ncbi:hypothetical protein SDJN02_20850, partial [Cucurbita argyrosperma subsp. argyrosperma]
MGISKSREFRGEMEFGDGELGFPEREESDRTCYGRTLVGVCQSLAYVAAKFLLSRQAIGRGRDGEFGCHALPNQEAVETFTRFTGASESLAMRKLEVFKFQPRHARPYRRCTFGVEDGSMMLRDLGLTGKQEALCRCSPILLGCNQYLFSMMGSFLMVCDSAFPLHSLCDVLDLHQHIHVVSEDHAALWPENPPQPRFSTARLGDLRPFFPNLSSDFPSLSAARRGPSSLQGIGLGRKK